MSEPENQTTDNTAEEAAQLPAPELNTNTADPTKYMVSIGDQTYAVNAKSAEEAGDKARKLAAKENK